VHFKGSGASKVPACTSLLEDTGACPPLGTHCRLEHPLRKRPSRCLGVFCIRGSHVTRYLVKKIIQDRCTCLIDGLGSHSKDPMEESN
jgi:hypothetical protein